MKLPALTPTATKGDGTANGYYGNSKDLREISEEPEHQGEQDVTGPYTPLHTGRLSNGKGGNMGSGAVAPNFITIGLLLHPIILVIMDITAAIITKGGRAFIISPGPVATPMPTAMLTMTAPTLRSLVAATPSFGGSGDTEARARTNTVTLAFAITTASCSTSAIARSIILLPLTYRVGVTSMISMIHHHWLWELTRMFFGTLIAIVGTSFKSMCCTADGKGSHATIISLAYGFGEKAKVNHRRL